VPNGEQIRGQAVFQTVCAKGAESDGEKTTERGKNQKG
jgi:hypothetical protein